MQPAKTGGERGLVRWRRHDGSKAPVATAGRKCSGGRRDQRHSCPSEQCPSPSGSPAGDGPGRHERIAGGGGAKSDHGRSKFNGGDNDGQGFPPAAGGTVVSPTRASLSVLDPQAMQELMVGNVVTPSQQDAVAPQPTTTGRQGRTVQQVSFALPDDPARATLLEKSKEQAHAQH